MALAGGFSAFAADRFAAAAATAQRQQVGVVVVVDVAELPAGWTYKGEEKEIPTRWLEVQVRPPAKRPDVCPSVRPTDRPQPYGSASKKTSDEGEEDPLSVVAVLG